MNELSLSYLTHVAAFKSSPLRVPELCHLSTSQVIPCCVHVAQLQQKKHKRNDLPNICTGDSNEPLGRL